MLFVTPFLPSPPRFGAQRRLHELISGIAASSETSVLSLVDPREDHEVAVQSTEAYCRRVVTVDNPAYHAEQSAKRLRQMASLASTHSYEWRGRREAQFAAALEQMLAHRFDVVQFSLAPMAGYASVARACGRQGAPRPLLCLDEHNIEYDIVRRTAHAASGMLRRVYSALEWRKVRREERRAWRGLDGCSVTSRRDQAMLLAEAPAARTSVVANGVDVDFFQPPPAPATPCPPALLFFGAMDYHPNTEAILYFLREVWPSLKSRFPDLALHVVGRKPPASVVAHRSARVLVTGVVEDVRPWLERASVVIVPLRIGGGTRLKILEAMAMGKAVVSTTLGAEGIDAVPERELLVADDAPSFASQVGRLLEEPALGRHLGAAARRLVASRYSWRQSVADLSTFYDELEGTRGAT